MGVRVKQFVLFKSTVSRSVDNLVHAGLVTREEHPADRRCVALRLGLAGAVQVARHRVGRCRTRAAAAAATRTASSLLGNRRGIQRRRA